MNSSANNEVKPNLEETFKTEEVREIANKALKEKLLGKTYSEDDALTLTEEIGDEINQRIVDLQMSRYKHVVNVFLGEKKGAGCYHLAKCRFDASTDTKISVNYSNDTIFAVVSVFGISIN